MDRRLATRPRAAVIYNPTKVDVETIRAVVQIQEKIHGWSNSLWLETSVCDLGQGRAAEAVTHGVTVIIAVGGDGMARAVAEGMHNSSIPLALLPSGTGNVLAGNLRLPMDDIQHSIEIAFTGVDRPVDLGLIQIRRHDQSTTDHVFLVMAGIGFARKIFVGTHDFDGSGGRSEHARGWRVTLRPKKGFRFECRLNFGPTRSLRARTIIVGNCGELPVQIQPLPDTSVSDGKFSVLVLRPDGFISWVRVFLEEMWSDRVLRRPKTDRAGRALVMNQSGPFRYVAAEDLKVTLRRAEEIYLDGDNFGTAVGFQSRIDPSGIRIRLPAPPGDPHEQAGASIANPASRSPALVVD